MDREELGRLLNLSTELVAAGRPNRPGTAISPTSITLHNTSNPNAGANAAAHSRMVRNKGYYELPSGKKQWVSWHFTVDDKQVIKQLPTSEMAYHAAAANGKSIAIEVCMHKEIDQQAADLRAARLVAALLYDHGWGVGAVKSHKEWTGKNCPVKLLTHFDAFKAQIESIRNSITGGRQEGLAASVDDLLDPPADAAKTEAPADAEASEAEIDHQMMAEQWDSESRDPS